MLGGDDSQNELNSIEVYDPKQDQWNMLPCKLTEPTSYAGLVLLDNTTLDQIEKGTDEMEHENRSSGRTNSHRTSENRNSERSTNLSRRRERLRQSNRSSSEN